MDGRPNLLKIYLESVERYLKYLKSCHRQVSPNYRNDDDEGDGKTIDDGLCGGGVGVGCVVSDVGEYYCNTWMNPIWEW